MIGIIATLLVVGGLIGIVAGLIGVVKPMFMKTRKKALTIAAASIGVMFFGGIVGTFDSEFQANYERQKQIEEAKEDKKAEEARKAKAAAEKAAKEKAEKEAAKKKQQQAEEYKEFSGNLVQRVGSAMDLVGHGFTSWCKGSATGKGMVEQGLKELNNEVKELNNLNPTKGQKKVHKDLTELVTGYRDAVEEALVARENLDVEGLNRATTKLNKLNEKIPGIMAQLQ